MIQIEAYKKKVNEIRDAINSSPSRKPSFDQLVTLYELAYYMFLDFPDDKKYMLSITKYIKAWSKARSADEQHEKLFWDTMLLEAKNYIVDSGLLFLEKNRAEKDRFYEPRREVLLKHNIIQSLQDLVDDKIDFFSLSLPPGCGKLLADDTPVLTESGWKNHGDLVVGDRVYGIDGKLKKVLHVFPKDTADCLVTFSNGEQIQCHKNHEWLVFDGFTDKYRIISTKDLQKENHLKYRYEIIREDFPIVSNKEFTRDVAIPKSVYIRSIKKVKPKPGNCIQVEDGIYCAGRTMIPTHNSTLEIFFLALVGGWFPNDFNLSSAHSSILTRSIYDGINEILDDPVEYAWHEMFPDVKIQGTNAKETTINLGKAGRFKTWTMRSIDGSLTGATRCNKFLTADDMVSGIEEALNKARLETLWTKVVNDLRSRRLDGCKEIYIATRWSVHDPIGKLQKLLEGSDRARFIAVPALDENGESNFLYKINGFSKEYFEQQRDFMDPLSFDCLYMQKAIEREGLLLPVEKLRRFFLRSEQVPDRAENYTIIPDREPDAVWAVCDTKDKGTDYESMPIAYQYGEDFYIVDVVFDDTTDYATLDQKTADMLIKHNPHMARFESNSAGGRVAYNVQNLIKGKCRTEIEPKQTTANKETKILVNSNWIIKHCLFLDASLYAPKSDYGLFIGNVVSYTTKSKVVHDDGIDSLAMLAEFVQKKFDVQETRVISSPY